MNPLLIESFQEELRKIATAQYVLSQTNRKAPEIRKLPTPPEPGQASWLRMSSGQEITAENLPKAIRKQLSSRAPRFAEDYARTAEEMAEQIRRAGGDPSTVPVYVRPGMRDTVRELRLNIRGLRRRKGEPRINRNVGGVPALPKGSVNPQDNVNVAEFSRSPKTDGFSARVGVSHRSPVTLAHELGHVADFREGSRPLGGRFPENLHGGTVGQEVAATKRALRTAYAKKNPADRAEILAATGTYMEKQVEPDEIRRTSDSPRRTAAAASRRAALRGPDPTYRKALSRSHKYENLFHRISRRAEAFMAEGDALARQRNDELSKLRNAALEAERRGDKNVGVLVKKYLTAEDAWNRQISEFNNKNRRIMAGLVRGQQRAEEGMGRNRRRYMDANPFIDQGLYERMTPQEKKYIDADIAAYRKNIAQQFGPEDANLYVREVRKALQSPTGRGLKTFLRRFK